MRKQKNKLAGLQRRKAIAGYIFIAPFILGFLVFMVKPFFQSLYMSFCNVEVSAGSFNPVFQGIDNYKRAFTIDPQFSRLLVEELSRMAVDSVAIMVFSFFVALILNQKFKGRALVRAIFFLPVILSSGVILGLETDNALMAQLQVAIEETTSGISITAAVEEILRTAGVGVRAFEKVFEIIDKIYDIAISSGIQIIIFLSGLQTISASMYEAADIEGCTKWESLWKITFPMISSMFLVNWIYTIIDFCMRSDNEVIEKITKVMVDEINYGFSSAMTWIYFLIVIAGVGGMCFMILQPILNKISVSFMEEQDLYNPVVVAIPEHFTTENYAIAAEIMDYSHSVVNSLVISLTIAILQITVCTLVGYGFARFNFPLKKFWFACVLMVVLVPPQTISTSLYLHFRFFDILGICKAVTGSTINLRGSVIPYYLMSAGCMGLKNGLYIYMIRQFFRNIPKELEEAAYVDGCGTLKTFVRIMLPDAKPILTSCFLFAFVWQWTDGLGAYLQRILGLSQTPSVGYANCISSTGTLMIIVPVLVLYLFAQRGFVESLSSSGIKM